MFHGVEQASRLAPAARSDLDRQSDLPRCAVPELLLQVVGEQSNLEWEVVRKALLVRGVRRVHAGARHEKSLSSACCAESAHFDLFELQPPRNMPVKHANDYQRFVSGMRVSLTNPARS